MVLWFRNKYVQLNLEMKSQTCLTFFVYSFYFSLFASLVKGNKITNDHRVSNFTVGVILDMDSEIGRVGWNCIEMALSDFYATHSEYKTRLAPNLRDSQGDDLKAAFAALDLLQNFEAQAIIGPQKSTQANLVINLGDKAQVPIISFSATSPSLPLRTPYFVQATKNDSSQVNAITSIIQDFKWKEVVIISENSQCGNGFRSYLINALHENQLRVPYKSVISLLFSDDQIRLELYKLMNMYNRVFIVHMSYTLGSRFFLLAKELGMMSSEYVWIITDWLMTQLDSTNTSVLASMQGVLGIKSYIRRSKELDNFTYRWKIKFHQEINIYGLWAYDTVRILAEAVERVGATKSLFKKPRTTANNTTDPETIRTSLIGPKLLDAISNTKLNGLSGEFHLINGKLQSSLFQILNIFRNKESGVGFWTSEHGISKDLNLASDNMHKTSASNFMGIVWPGETRIVPRGWVIPKTGKKLKFAVPLKKGFHEMIMVNQDNYTNKTNASGYIIEFFNAVMEALPYAVAYEFVAFPIISNGSSPGSYNDLVHQVYLQRYDAVVGDTSITANRSLEVDFTLPYSRGGISMMVPVKHDNNSNTWIFLKPLTKDLWLTSMAFFIITGFVIWVLEHRINEAFRGPPSQNVGMIFWFPFSTLVFAHRERIVSNLTRFVVIIWIFVVLVLSSSYTANLSSMLTVQNLQPHVTSVEELKKNGDYVGYQRGSFIREILIHTDHFDERKLRSYKSIEDLNEGLIKGSHNGGIAAFFDVVPYIELFTEKYCGRYIMAGPIHKTEGFGFIFPKGSPLVADVSREILKFSEGSKMKALDQALFRFQSSCSDPEKNVDSSSLKLNFNSFRGLFIITGVVSAIALLSFLFFFLYKNKNVFATTNSSNTLWQKLKTMLKQFDKRDLSSYPFKKVDIESQISGDDIELEAFPRFTSSTSTNSYGNLSPVEGSRMQTNLDDFSPSPINSAELDDVSLSD